MTRNVPLIKRFFVYVLIESTEAELLSGIWGMIFNNPEMEFHSYRESSVRWFLCLMCPIYAANKDLNLFFIWPNISGDMRGFNSLRTVGECAKRYYPLKIEYMMCLVRSKNWIHASCLSHICLSS
jgi:hypothetical protein